MLVNELVKGQEVLTSYGKHGTVVSKAKGIRICLKIEVPGQGYDIGDVYVWQVAGMYDEHGFFHRVHLTDRQQAQAKKVRAELSKYGMDF